MAALEDLKDAAERRLAATWIPADVLARLTREELRLRCRHARELLDRSTGSGIPQESYLALQANARKVLRSVPASEYRLELGKRTELAANAPGADARLSYRAMVDSYRDSQLHPPALLWAVEQTLLGKYVPDPELKAVAQAAIAACPELKPALAAR